MSHFLKLSRLVTAVILLLCLSSCRTLNENSAAEEGITQAVFATIDADADGKSSAEEMAAFQHREALAEFDLDSDEHISLSEWKVAKPSAPEDAPHFMLLDSDTDGKISEEEAVAFITANEAFQAAFTALDANNDTLLTWEEFEAGESDALVVPLFGESGE